MAALPIAAAIVPDVAPIERRAAGAVTSGIAIIALPAAEIASVILAVAAVAIGFGGLGAIPAAIIAISFRTIVAVAGGIPGFAIGAAHPAAAVFAPALARIAPIAFAALAILIAIAVALRVVPPTIIVWHSPPPSCASKHGRHRCDSLGEEREELAGVPAVELMAALRGAGVGRGVENLP